MVRESRVTARVWDEETMDFAGLSQLPSSKLRKESKSSEGEIEDGTWRKADGRAHTPVDVWCTWWCNKVLGEVIVTGDGC